MSTEMDVSMASTESAPGITEPGIYDIPAAAYHADPCPEPSLSRSILHPLINLSPAHAYAIHPRLGGRHDPDVGSDDEVQDAGTAAHASFLQGRSIIRRLDFKDWKTNAAKEARALAYADGMIPLLSGPYGRAMTMIDALEAFRAKTGAFTAGKGEQTVVWREENGIWCRAMVDWLPDDPAASPWDLKTTGGRATVAAWSRIAFDRGSDLQASLYCRGLEMVRGEPPGPMHFCVIEQKPPYGIKVFIMSPIADAQAEDDIDIGISLWGNCLATGRFEPYSLQAEWLMPPSWITRGREERKFSQRGQDVAAAREHPLGIQYVETDDFGA
jgi:PDDEXK-like uncharacterized protein DUF3799